MDKTNPLIQAFAAHGAVDGAVAARALKPPHEDWVVVLVFVTRAGSTEMVSHVVCPRPDFFRTDEQKAKKWMIDVVNVLPLEGSLPGYRLSSRLVRAAPAAEVERYARGWIAHLASQRSMFKPERAGDPLRKPRGPKSGGDLRLAEVARDYVNLLGEEQPVGALARKQEIARSTAQSYLFRARERGLLTSAGRGRAGGALTERAKQLLTITDGVES